MLSFDVVLDQVGIAIHDLCMVCIVLWIVAFVLIVAIRLGSS